MKKIIVRSSLVLMLVAKPVLGWTSPGAAICMASSFASALSDIDPHFVTAKDGNAFYTDDEAAFNYAAAKQLISLWIEANGIDQLLLNLRTGKPLISRL